jgi:dihydropyrimidine dehydrogenase (NAD+) subunit PreA
VAKSVQVPISGIGGIGFWNDAAEHIALGASTVQVCTAAMHYGFRIVEDMIDGLSQYMDARGFRSIEDFRGRALANVCDWGDLDLNYKIVAEIHSELCIGCQLCYVACEDGAHQCIAPHNIAAKGLASNTLVGNGKKNPNGMGVHVPRILEDECVGCNLCALVCPVDSCITMREVDTGKPPMTWNQRMRSQADSCAPPSASAD